MSFWFTTIVDCLSTVSHTRRFYRLCCDEDCKSVFSWQATKGINDIFLVLNFMTILDAFILQFDSANSVSLQKLRSWLVRAK